MKKRLLPMLLAVLTITMLVGITAFARPRFSLSPETYTVSDTNGDPVSPGDETYTTDTDNIYVHGDFLTISGTTDKTIVLKGTTYLKLVNLNCGPISGTDLLGSFTINMENANISGDVSFEDNGTEYIYPALQITGENTITGSITSTGSLTVFGDSGATLSFKQAITNDIIYLSGISLFNMQETYIVTETKTATPIDDSQPVVFVVKKTAVFPEEDEFIINNGEPFSAGKEYTIPNPPVYDENGDLIDPQPELIIQYYTYEQDEYGYIISIYDENDPGRKPLEEGSYCIGFYVSDEDPEYYGSQMYNFTIGPNEEIDEEDTDTTNTDTKKESTNGKTAAKTGDTSNPLLWIVILGITFLVIIVCIILYCRSRRNQTR